MSTRPPWHPDKFPMLGLPGEPVGDDRGRAAIIIDTDAGPKLFIGWSGRQQCFVLQWLRTKIIREGVRVPDILTAKIIGELMLASPPEPEQKDI